MTTTMVRRMAFVGHPGAFALTLLVGCGGVRKIPLPGRSRWTAAHQWRTPVFTPDPAKGNVHRISCTSRIKEGHYDLETNGITPSDSGNGVPLGWYKVSFRMLEESTKKHPIAPINVHDRFRNPDKTPLAVEVKDNPEPGSYDIKMTTK